MTKISNQYSLTNILTADLANSRLGINNVSPTVALDVTGAGKFSGNVVLSGSDSRFNGGDSVGRLILSNSNTTTYIALYGATHPTLPYVMSFVVNAASALAIASTGAATFSSSVTAAGYFVSGDNGIKLNSIVAVQSQQLQYQNNGTNKFQLYLDTADNSYNIYGNATASVNFKITSAGNVGIGTSSPSQILDVRKATVSGNTQFNFLNSQNSSAGNTSVSSTIYLGFCDDGGGVANANKITSGKSGDYTSQANANSFLAFHTTNANSTVERMRINSSGNLLLGVTSDVAAKIYIVSSIAYGIVYQDTANANNFYVGVAGDGYLRASAWSYGSDIRMKENIYDVVNGLELVSKLKPKHFDYIDGIKNNLGFIAQDVQELIPQAVTISDEKTGMLGLKTDFIIPYLTKAIQELSAENTSLKNRIEALENK